MKSTEVSKKKLYNPFVNRASTNCLFFELLSKRNFDFVTNFDFLIPISLKPDGVNL